MLAFDIETGPLGDEALKAIYTPLEDSDIEGLVTGDFDPNSVKLGNLKDATKIAEKIEQARAAHESAKANSAAIIAQAKADHWSAFVARAPLSPITGQILVIGYHASDKGVTLVDEGNGSETTLIVNFWGQYQKCRDSGRKMVGHNIVGFDIPFIVRRSWFLDIPVPATVFDKGKWLDDRTFADTMSLWGCGNRGDSVKLDVLARAFGVGAKTEGVTGGQFWQLYRGNEVERAKAIEYAANDVEITARVAKRMGIV